MNKDHSDLEARLRAWRPTELPTGLHARLRTACPPPKRRRPIRALAGELAMAAVVAWLAVRFAAPSGSGDLTKSAPGDVSEQRSALELERFAGTPWLPGESLTMNLSTGVAPGVVPAALRLDDGPTELSDLILIRSADGKLPLKVDCQF